MIRKVVLPLVTLTRNEVNEDRTQCHLPVFHQPELGATLLLLSYGTWILLISTGWTSRTLKVRRIKGFSYPLFASKLIAQTSLRSYSHCFNLLPEREVQLSEWSVTQSYVCYFGTHYWGRWLRECPQSAAGHP